MENVIEINNLTKSYGKARGVQNVSFSVTKGDVFGFLGPNGAGKSTTIRCMLGFINYQEGCVKVLGHNVKSGVKNILKDVGYMPSEAMFYQSARVKDIIKMAAGVRGMDCSKEAGVLCERLQLDVDRKISELSLGNRKKVSIVCAMQHKPKLFVFDEPTSGLDPLMQFEFFDLVNGYVNEGATCMLSTHVLSEVKKYCNNVAIMKEGKLQCVHKVAELTKASSKRIKLVRDGIYEDFLFEGDLNDIYKELKGRNITDILIEEPSLDEVFMKYYE